MLLDGLSFGLQQLEIRNPCQTDSPSHGSEMFIVQSPALFLDLERDAVPPAPAAP